MGELSDLVERTSSPADLAVVLLAGSAGLVVDAGLNVVGFLSPGTTAFAAASIALGLKKSLEAKYGTRWATRREEQRLAAKVGRVLDALPPTPKLAVRELLRGDHELYEEGLLTQEELEDSIAVAVEFLRQRRSLGGSDPS